MTHMLEGWLKGAKEKAEKENAFKEVSEATLWDQIAALATIERRIMEAKRACVAAKKRMAELEGKLADVKVKLA